nr:SprT-like domain-containing protein [Mycobacterium sp. E3298]
METSQSLQEKAKFFVKHLWNMELDIPVRVNNRLKRTYGWCAETYIELSPRILHDELMTDDTLLHELCHWYCRKVGQEYDDHTTFFEDELERIGASSTETTIFKNGAFLYLYPYGCYKCTLCEKNYQTRDYLEEKQEGKVGRAFKKYECCGVNMKYTGRRFISEPLEENDKLKAVRSAYNKYKKGELVHV